MAKELTLEQVEGDGGAVQLNEGAAISCAEVVNRLRDQLFPGSRFALNQYGGPGRRDPLHLLEHRVESRTTTHDLLKLRPPIVAPKTAIFEASHNIPPKDLLRQVVATAHSLQSRSDAIKQNAASKGLAKNPTAPALIA